MPAVARPTTQSSLEPSGETVGLPEDLVLGEEARQAGDAGDGQRADEHGPVRDRDLVLRAAHAAHVLLAAHGVDHGAGAEEEQGLEEGVREEVEDRHPVRAHAQRQEHVAELADGGVGQHALDVVLHQRDGGREDRGERAHRRPRSCEVSGVRWNSAFERATM